MASVRMRELVKRFGAATIIPSLDLQIRDGEFVVFVGPSGCGKSTLLRIIAGLEPVDAGDVFIDEVRVNDLPAARRDIAMVFQDYALYPHMNVYENMAFGLQMRNMPRAEIDRRVRQTAALLRIESLLDRKPKALSGGQRQRVAMGRAMVRDPKVFLFDEPLSNLDAKLRADVRTEIKALFLKLQTTMIFVTHDQVEAMTMADRIVVIRGGVVQQVGTPEEVYARPANRFVAEFIGSPTMNFFGARLDGDRVRLSDGTSLSLPGERLSAVRRHGARALVLGVRPEHLRLGPEGNGALAVTASVIEPLGSDTLVYFEYEGTRHVARVSPELHPRVGERLALAPSMTQAHLFDANDGLALR